MIGYRDPEVGLILIPGFLLDTVMSILNDGNPNLRFFFIFTYIVL